MHASRNLNKFTFSELEWENVSPGIINVGVRVADVYRNCTICHIRHTVGIIAVKNNNYAWITMVILTYVGESILGSV